MIKSPQSQRQEEEIAQHHLLPELSPFQNGRKHRKAHLYEAQPPRPGLAMVISVSEALDKEGNPKHSTRHLVGRHCLHWAPRGAETGTCRFGC
jgi:hypothetical protein